MCRYTCTVVIKEAWLLVTNCIAVVTCIAMATHIQNGSVTVSTAWSKQFMIVLLTESLPVVFEEGNGSQFYLTLRAGEVLRMP